MLHISEAMNILNDGNSHNVKWVSKTDGSIIEMNDVIVLSSNYEKKKFNLKSKISGQIRMCYADLMVELDNNEIFL